MLKSCGFGQSRSLQRSSPNLGPWRWSARLSRFNTAPLAREPGCRPELSYGIETETVFCLRRRRSVRGAASSARPGKPPEWFPVHLTATWTANAIVHATRDGAAVLDETLPLADRVGDYDLRYQVRESQPVIVR